MFERSGSSADYRYGFNGMEKNDDDIWGIKDSYDFGERMYDSRIGRWFKIDPQASQMPQISPYSFALNNPVFLIDEDGEIPIIPFLIKATASAAADALLQASLIYLTDDSVKDFGSAFKKIDKSDVAWSFVEGLNPFKVPGGKLGKAAAVATADLLIYVGEQTLDGKEITAADAGREFLIGFFSELAGDKASELLTNKKVRAKLGALIGEKELDKIAKKAGVYEFTDTKGKSYTGQSVDIDSRLDQHIKNGKLDPKNKKKVKITEVAGDKTDREIVETKILDSKGGANTKSKPNSKVSNKVRPISAAREKKLRASGKWKS
jgi:RHS repeat-associated protein